MLTHKERSSGSKTPISEASLEEKDPEDSEDAEHHIRVMNGCVCKGEQGKSSQRVKRGASLFLCVKHEKTGCEWV